MMDYDRYIVEICIYYSKFKIFIPVHKSIPDECLDEIIQEEVFKYLKSIVRYNYSLKLF